MSATIRADQIVLEAECYLGDWAYSLHSAKRTVDAKALFYFADDDDMQPLTAHETRAGQGKKIAGKRFRMVLIAEDDETPDSLGPPHAQRQYGQFAKDLKLSGFCRRPDVWRALGTDGQFRDWVTRQVSIVSGQYSEHDEAGEPRNVACHVRRAGEAGTAHKPDYACVPMTDGEHQIQHQSGEAAIYARAMIAHGQTAPMHDPQTPRLAGQWFDQQRIKTVERWAWEALKAHIGVESMADAHPDLVFDWALGEGLASYLPAAYRRGESRGV